MAAVVPGFRRDDSNGVDRFEFVVI